MGANESLGAKIASLCEEFHRTSMGANESLGAKIASLIHFSIEAMLKIFHFTLWGNAFKDESWA